MCRTVSKIISRNSTKHFSHEHPFEQFKLDHLVLHTVRCEVMGFEPSYMLQDLDVSYIRGTHSFVFLFFSKFLLTYLYI